MNGVEIVKKICKERKIPISKLERDLGYGNGYISQLKRGSFPAERAMEISRYLNIDINIVTYGDESPVQPDLSSVNTIAAHFDGEEFSDDEWQDIVNYMNYVKSKRG